MTALRIETPRVCVPMLQRSRYKALFGGRAAIKSNFFAQLLLMRSMEEKIDAVCVRETQRSLQFSVKKLLESKIETMNAGAYFDVQDKRIYSTHGGVTIFEGMQNHTAETIKSLEGFDIGWFEEAQAMSQRSLDMLRPTIRKPDSELWFSWNPRFATDPIDVFFRDPNAKPPPDSIVIRTSYKDNPFRSAVIEAEIAYDKARDPDKYAHVWLGEYVRNSEARVFKNWTIEEFEAKPGTAHRLGADWGFAVDPSVLVRCHVEGRRMYVDYEAYMVGCEIDQLPDLFDRIPESRKFFITADSARPETISYMRNHGYPKINKAIKGAKSVEEGVEFLKTYDIVVHPRCIHTIDELTLYSYKIDADTEKVLPILDDKSNNVIDALRYANESARRIKADEPAEEKDEGSIYHGELGWMAG